MPIKDRTLRNAYLRDWKRKRRKELGKLPRGKHKRKIRTEEEINISKENRKVWERQWKSEYSKTKPEKRLLYAAKKRAKNKGLDFNLVESDILIPEYCPYLGIKLVVSRPRGDSRRDIASLDRIDNTKGYIQGNVEVISWLANTMKSNATIENLVSFAKEILKRHE